MSLSPKQERFVAEYLKDSNATQAAIRAGYSKRSAGSQAHDLLKKPEISAAVQGGAKQAIEQAGMTAADILRGLAVLACSAEKDSDKIAALGLLGKHLKLFTDKLELKGALTLEQIVLAADRRARDAAKP